MGYGRVFVIAFVIVMLVTLGAMMGAWGVLDPRQLYYGGGAGGAASSQSSSRQNVVASPGLPPSIANAESPQQLVAAAAATGQAAEQEGGQGQTAATRRTTSSSDAPATPAPRDAFSPPAGDASSASAGSSSAGAATSDSAGDGGFENVKPVLRPAANSKATPGNWNGIPMLVNTNGGEFMQLGPSGPKIEPIEARLKIENKKLLRLVQPLLPNVEVAPQARKVWIDLGARFFHKGSTHWFERFYPSAEDFDVVLFDVLDLRNTYPDAIVKKFKSFTFNVKAAWMHERGVEIKGMKMARVADENDPHAVAFANKDTRSTWKIESVDMAAFLRNYTKDDFVVLKMDIEGGEWELLAHLLKTGTYELIDELMLECHPRLLVNPRDKYLHQSCVDLINHFRTLGIAAHRWV